MTRVIAIANQKGGVAKTTTAVNLACGWARLRGPGKVLFIDADPQANGTMVFLGVAFAGGPPRHGVHTLHDVMLLQAEAKNCLYTVEFEANDPYSATAVDILPTHAMMSRLERKITSEFRADYRLREQIEEIVDHYEMVVIDCPPSLGLLTANAFVAATEVLVPVSPGYFPLVGISYLEQTIQEVQRGNPAVHISGVLPTMVDRTIEARDTREGLRQRYGDLLLPPIPRRVSISEAHINGTDIFGYDPAGDGAKAHAKMVREVMQRD